ncbi:MAG TPA: hypothetical protein VNY33_03820 [Gaiellaceae bacterium]|nr:hypothetical protein [Gaiellaceae bacterium]
MQTHERDLGLRRLKRITLLCGVGAGTLAAAFAGLAARSLPGKHTVATVRRPSQVQNRTATPPPLVPVQAASAAPAAPSAPPVASSAPPVVVSGGS